MRTYSGRLWLVQDRHSEVEVEVSLDEERVKITSNGTLIGDWSFDDVDIKRRGENIHVLAEDEEVVISSSERGFKNAILRAGRADRWRRTGDSEQKEVGSPFPDPSADYNASEDDLDGRDETEKRERPRRGAHRQPWSLKLRW